MKLDDKTRDVLEGLSAEVLAVNAADKEGIVRVGTRLEGILEQVAAAEGGIGSLLEAALSVLQGVYQDALSDPQGAMAAVAEAVGAAAAALGGEEALAGDPTLEQAAEKVAVLVGALAAGTGGPAPAPPKADTPAPEPPPALTPQAAEHAEPPAAPIPAPTPQATEHAEPVAAPATPVAQPAAVPAAVLPADTDLALLKEYIVESLDHIAAAEAALLALESDPDDSEQINTIFRAFHTIKGTSGFLGLERIQTLAHRAESLLDRARNGEIHVTGGYADLSLQSCDLLRVMIQALDGASPGGALAIPPELAKLLEALADPAAAGISGESDEALRVGDILVGQGRVGRDQVEQAVAEQADRPIGEVLVERGAARPTDVAKALRVQQQMRTGRGAAAEATVRVSTSRLDNLINMVGELVIAQSMVAQDPHVVSGRLARLSRSVSHAGKIIRELQDLTMSMRMVPLKATFQKMARLVRDLAHKSGKKVQYVTEGEETEIDRNMVEVLNDPLVHMIRNAVDHGIEAPDRRRQAGKDETGTVRLRAYHSAGNVVIELADDGKGLDRQKIVAKAVERGLIDAGRDLADSEAFALIFQPGFSTAEKVTDVSGRGVGMDVVKRGIESLRGRVEVASTVGAGSTFTIRLPLTMAITDAMLVRVGREKYLLPTVSIEQSFRPTREAISTVTGRGEMVMLRGDLLPMYRLHRLYGVSDAVADPCDGLLIVIESQGQRCAVMVDELLGQQQVVIKSLGQSLGNLPGVAGGAILGDGRVGLILDADGIMRLAQHHLADAAEAA